MQVLMGNIELMISVKPEKIPNNIGPFVVIDCCDVILNHLRVAASETHKTAGVKFQMSNSNSYMDVQDPPAVHLIVHRVRELADLIEVNFILAFTGASARSTILTRLDT